MPKPASSLLFTCEHASNRIPAPYQLVAQNAGKELETHRGYDPGARELAKKFNTKFKAPLFIGKWSRLLFELNRSLHHRRLFSEFSRSLSKDEKRTLVEECYLPYRNSVETHIREENKHGRRVIHIGVHSFTPTLNGEIRNADIGLLYDPAREGERQFCKNWANAIRSIQPNLRVRKNYPYRGTDDGFTTYLRTRFKESDYLGIELEVNQRFPAGPAEEWRLLQQNLMKSIALTLSGDPESRGEQENSSTN